MEHMTKTEPEEEPIAMEEEPANVEQDEPALLPPPTMTGDSPKEAVDTEAAKMDLNKVKEDGDKNKEKKDDGDDEDDDNKSNSSSSFGSNDFDASDDSGFSPDNDPTEVIIKSQQYKENGNEYFKQGDLSKAAREFRKGIFDLKGLNKNNTGDEQVKSLLMDLHNNLSLVAFKQQKYKQSFKVASATLRIDPANVKGLYRRAVAQRKMGNHKEAKRDLKEAFAADPSNTAVKKELRSVIKYLEDMATREKNGMKKAFSFGLYDDKVEAEKRKAAEEKRRKKEAAEALKKRKEEWEDESVQRMAKDEPAISFEDWEQEQKEKELAAKKEVEAKRKAERKAKREAERKMQQEEEDDDDDDELTASELQQLRGYKKTSDGRTTSYFTREQSEEEKQLLGSIAPRRLDSQSPVPSNDAARVTPVPERGLQKSMSAWNQSGTTWEEKDTTEWCTKSLKTHLKSTTARNLSGDLVASVSKLSSLTGDASVAVAGGKKRYIFDFHCTVNFEIRESGTDDVIASGSLKCPDINSASHDELEVEVGSWEKAPSSQFQDAAQQCRSSLVKQVRRSVKNFVSDFNEQY